MSSERLAVDDVDLGALLSLLGAAVEAHVLHRLHEAGLEGLRPGHGYLIQHLVNGPSTVAAITASVDVSQQAVSKTLRELVALGYVLQTADVHDRRRRPVHLSSRGREAVEVSRRSRREFEDRVRDRVDEADLAAARRVLRAAVDALGLTESIARRALAPPPERS